MATAIQVVNGLTFVTNNYAAILTNDDAPSEFHMVQDFLSSGPLGFALTNPSSISFNAVNNIWSTTSVTDKEEIEFQFDGKSHIITRKVIAKALQIATPNVVISYSESNLRDFMLSLGYNTTIKTMGTLKRTSLPMHWNFFFDCIGRAFTNKCLYLEFNLLPMKNVTKI